MATVPSLSCNKALSKTRVLQHLAQGYVSGGVSEQPVADEEIQSLGPLFLVGKLFPQLTRRRKRPLLHP